MNLTKADIGKKFNTQDGGVLTGVAITAKNFITVNDEGYSHSHLLNGESDQFDEGGSRERGLDIISRQDPRSWLADMPNLGDIKEGWIACDSDSDEEWYWYSIEPNQKSRGWYHLSVSRPIELDMFNMPTLTGDQWKDSKISVAELKQLQADNS